MIYGDQKSPFGSAEVLNTELGSQLFRFVVGVNPIATVNSLYSAFAKMDKEMLKKIGPGRRNLIWAIEKLCFRKETFETAAKILYAFAVSENENWSNNATGQFVQLFQTLIPGTETDFDERLKIISYGLEKNDKDYTKIAIQALGHGLTTFGFTRNGGAETQGSGKPLKDYEPSSNDEIRAYHQKIFSLLILIIKKYPEYTKLVKEQISLNVRGLIGLVELDTVSEVIKELNSLSDDTWYDLINDLRITLQHEQQLQSDEIEAINNLINDLLPKDIVGRIRILISVPDWEQEKQADGSFKDKADERAEQFAIELINDKVELSKYLPNLLIDEQRKAFTFGKKLGELISDKESFLTDIINTLVSIPKENQNTELLIGFLQHFEEDRRRQIVNQIIRMPEVGFNSIYLARWYLNRKDDLLDLLSLVDDGKLNINQVKVLVYGNFYNVITAEDLGLVCRKIYSFSEQGKWIALEILSHYCYQNIERFNGIKNVVKEFICNFNYLTSHTKELLNDYNYTQFVKAILKDEIETGLAEITSTHIFAYFAERNRIFSEIYITEICRTLVENHFLIFWNVIAPGILEDGPRYLNIKFILGARQGNFHTFDKLGILFSGETEPIIDWCKNNLPKAPLRIAYMMPISKTEKEKIPEWHSFARRMIDEFGNIPKFLNEVGANIRSFGWTGFAVPYYEGMKKLIEELLNHRFSKVKEWAKKMIESLNAEIIKERIENEESFLL